MSSLLMTPADHYAANHENSPTQTSMGFGAPYGAMYGHGNQWQTVNRSPNSMGSNGSPSPMNPMPGPSSSMSAPTVPSPLLHSMSSSNMTPGPPVHHPGAHSNPNSQPPPVKTPMSSQSQGPMGVVPMLKNPFEEDVLSRPPSRHQMPPPGTPQHWYFDMVKGFRLQHYVDLSMNMNMQLRARIPYAFNTQAGEKHNFNYPEDGLPQRTPFHVYAQFMKPNMPAPLPPPTTTPAPPTTTNKRSKKKKSEPQPTPAPPLPLSSPAMDHERNKQVMANHVNGMMPHQNGVSFMPPMGPMEPRMSDTPNGMNSPSFMAQQLKGRPTSADNYSPFRPNADPCMLKSMVAMKSVINAECSICKAPITPEKPGIRCTALSQGCGHCYHMECSGLNPAAFNMLIGDPRCEWACLMCSKQKRLYYHT